jgi:hypothetical protein
MKMPLRLVAALCVLLHCSLFFLLNSEQVSAQYIQRRYYRKRSTTELPFYGLTRTVSIVSLLSPIEDEKRDPFSYSKLRFAPVKILGRVVQTPKLFKEFPDTSRASKRKKILPGETRKPHTGVIVELESAYGIYNTFIGRLQHGTQFKGAHYYISGHWEKTDGEYGGDKEENIAASMKVDWDISKSSTVSLNSSYFQSDIALPQLSGNKRHEKSAIQLLAELQVNFEPNIDLSTALSGEQARFSDHNDVTFEMNSYGGQFQVKQLLSAKNTLGFHSAGYWEEYFQENEHIENRYYGTSTLINSFAMHDNFTIDAGIQFDYYHSEDLHHTEYLIAPVVTTRFHFLRNTTLYITYHPHLKFPRFTDLYIRKLYTTVNPELYSEKERNYVESGIHQRFGDALSFNIGFFYHENEDVILQIDENSDNILEYDQLGSTDFIGVRANLQMNYLEQFVQNITYTYTKHNIFSGQDIHRLEGDAYNEILPYQPNHQVHASIYWMIPFGLAIDFNGTYVSEQFRNRYRNQRRIGKRFFLNVDITQHITDNFQVFLLGRNLTDTNTYDIIPILDTEEITSSQLFIGGIRFRF